MSDSEHDDEFEAYLKWRASGGTGRGLEPPPELDRIIIGNARKAIQGAAPVPLYRAPRWALPVALAATIVISFVVALELGLRPKHQAVPAQEPVDTGIVADAPLIPDVPAPAPAAQEIQTPAASSHVANTRRSASRTTVADSTGAPKASSPPQAVARLRLPAIPTNPWPPVATSNAPPATDATQQAADEKSRTRLARVEVAEARSRVDPEAPGEPAPSISNAEPNPSAASPPRVAYAAARPPTEATPSVVTLEEVVVVGPAPSHHGRADHLDPATWVNEIEKLHSAGRTAEAEREIKRFRETYPAYPLPAEAAAADVRAH